LPTRINMDWPHQINSVVFSTVQDPLGADITSIDERHGLEEALWRLNPLEWEPEHDDLVQWQAPFPRFL